MTIHRASLAGLIAAALVALCASGGVAGDARCTEGRWRIDGDPVTIGPLAIGVVGLRDGVPVLDTSCRAVRWALGRAEGETHLRARFACQAPDATRHPRHFPLRLRARIVDGCEHMLGAFEIRRLGEIVRFTATLAGDGCASNADCAAETYCATPFGECAARGTCEPRAQGCPDVYLPVCGCDRQTYGNRCEAAAAGVSVAREGECPDVCGGIAGIPCAEGEFCELPAGECGSADLQGRCVPLPDVCPKLYAPVCGCDGVTYGNDCERRQAGAQKAHDGSCAECASNAHCEDTEYCAKPRGHCDARGQCEPRPQGCPDNVDPVCGCDRVTYFNACEAAAAGVSVAHAGECRAVCGGIAGVPCAEGEFCELPAGECGSADLQGRCVGVGDACPEFYSPVCGCDGVTYANDCFRQVAKAQKAHDGACECVPVCCTLRSEPADTDGDGCDDACVPTSKCGGACDCYPPFGSYKFCDDCPLLCPNCGNYWDCVDSTCIEQCGPIPPDVAACF